MKGSDLTETQVYKAKEGLEVVDVPDGYVVYDTDSDMVHYLNPTAAIVFTLCDGTRNINLISKTISSAYSLETELVLGTFVEELEQAGLICPAA
jgi:hypothetical protein